MFNNAKITHYCRSRNHSQTKSHWTAKAAQMVSTLSPGKKIEWANIHRQRGNSLFKKGDYKEAMDVYLTCLVAIEHDGGDGITTDTIKSVFLSGTTATEEDEDKDGASMTTIPAISSCTVNTIMKNDNVNNEISGDDSKTVMEEDTKNRWNRRTDEEIKLPILLNLSLCTLKMGMYQKTEQFCNFVIMEMPCGRTSTKAYFRRGRARMLMGSYRGAKEDFDIALELLSESIKGGSDDDANTDDIKEREAEFRAVKNEMVKLSRLTKAGQKNRAKCERAMKKILGGGDVDINESKGVICSSVEEATIQNEFNDTAVTSKPVVKNNPVEDSALYSTRLYEDVARCRTYSTLRAKSTKKREDQHIPGGERSFVLWYILMMERSLRKILYWFGDKDAMTRSFEELEEEFSKTTYEKKQL